MAITLNRSQATTQADVGTVKYLNLHLGWAFSPWSLLLSLPLPIFIVSVLQGPEVFARLGQPFFLNQTYYLLATCTFFILLFVFAINTRNRHVPIRIGIPSDLLVRLRNAKNALTFIVFAAYGIWALSGISKGLSFGILFDALNGNNGAIWKLKTEVLAPISGVTSWVALATILGPLAIIFWRVTGERQLVLLGSLVFVTVLRSTFFSERLALVEVAISCLIAYSVTTEELIWPVRNLKNYLLTLSVAFSLYLAFFSATELIRSWVYYSTRTQVSVIQFSFERIVAYYSTALNNGALYIDVNKYVWSPFDLIQGTFDNTLASSSIAFLGGTGVDKFSNALVYRSNPEFNNVSGLLITNSSLGILGSWVFWIFISVLTVSVYNRAAAGSLIAFFAYPIFVVGVLEVVRIFYFGQTRIVPNLLALAVFYFYLGRFPHSVEKAQT
jgi:hypothetical protein